MRLPNLASVQPLHLCVIIGNGLQNALEASQQLPEDAERKISIRAVMTEGRIVISITNRFAGQLTISESGEITTSKTEPGHGLGLASIRETIRRYNGWCGVSTQGEEFTLNVTLSPDA